MALDSSSKRQDAIDQYNDNLSWEGNPAKATLALEAVRFLEVNRPTQFTKDQGSFTYAELQQTKAKLEAFVSRSGSAVKRVLFTRGRLID